MLESNKVRASEEGKARLRKELQYKNLTQDELAQASNVSVDTFRRLLGTKRCLNGVERWAVKNIAEVLGIKPTDIVAFEDWYPYQQLPLEFEALIEEKVQVFCGRKFVFAAFEQFTKDNPKGYFTVVGDAGMGKSSIAAKYAYDKRAICYFNVLGQRRNRPEQFLESIRQQIINRYQFQDAEKAELPTLLEQVSRKLSTAETLVIVVDALDEVEQKAGAENILYLPEYLPENVYFLLTRRPYNLGNKRLKVSPGVPVGELDLTTSEYSEYSHQDVKEYIKSFLNEDLEYKDTLKRWIQDRDISPETFTEQVAVKSENNFMYLRYVLPGIARGFYDDLSLKQLPDGLKEYYQNHWVRMGMDAAPQKLMVMILFILVEISTGIPCEMLAEIAEQDESEVQSVLNKWVEYLKKHNIKQEICYSIYHTSFLDFLKDKIELRANRKLFQEINNRIADYLY